MCYNSPIAIEVRGVPQGASLFYYLKNIMKKILLSLAITLTVFMLVLVAARNLAPRADASVAFGNDYQATTTDQTWTTAIPKVLDSSNGSLGSVVITTTGTGSLTLYDATTTNINLRTGGTATSTITLANFQITTTAGTYTFDRVFFNGLIAVWTGTNAASTTITYR